MDGEAEGLEARNREAGGMALGSMMSRWVPASTSEIVGSCIRWPMWAHTHTHSQALTSEPALRARVQKVTWS